MKYEIARISLIGNRKTNQDRLGIAESHAGVVLILGDGLGGKPGGELASETLIKSVQHELRHEVMPVINPEKLLEKLIIKAHFAVRSQGAKQTPPIEPGSTAVICLIQNKKAWWAHVGDSRCYLFRNGLPLYRTKDDSYVEELYQKGEISIENRDKHPMRNYVTQCIGVLETEPKVTTNKGVELEKGDTLVLCSDGFWEPLDDALIGAALTKNDLQETVRELATQAEQDNYPTSDNISVIAMKIIDIEDTALSASAKKSKESNTATPLDGAIKEIEDAINYYKDEMKE